MPAVTTADLNNAKLDVDHIAAIATSQALTAVDRLGQTKQTLAGLIADLNATALATETGQNSVEAQQARDAALIAAATSGVYPNAAATNVPRGLTQASVGAITPGAGGTNGTFALAWTGGNFAINPTGTFTVAGGALTAVTITGPGLYIGAAPTVPTPSFAASAGLAGAAVALTAQFLVTAGQGYWVQSTDGRQLLRYKNVAGVATSDAASIGPVSTAPEIPSLVSRAVAGSEYAHLDGNDNAGLLVEDAGHTIANLTAETFNGIARPELARRLRRADQFFSASIVMHISYGQSLSLGNGSGINALPGFGDYYYDSLMFSANGTLWAGPRAQEGSGTEAQNHATLVPFEERPLSGGSPTGNSETPLGGIFRMIKKLLWEEDGIHYTDFNYRLLGSAPGQSNTSITGLEKNTAPYLRLLADVTYALARAQELGESFAVDVVHWFHGERDIADGMSRATYLTKFLQLYTDLNADIKAIVGPSQQDIKIIAYQCTLPSSSPNIALAQLDAAKANPNIILATASYAPEHFDPTNAHLAGTGSPHLGSYNGLTAKRCVIDRETWPTMYPRRFIRQGNILEAEWPDTGYPLMFTTAFFAQVANEGFTALRADLVTDNPILSATVVSPRRVRYVLTHPEAGKLRYGFSSWGGNLVAACDIDPDLVREVPLYLPCLTFEESFA